MYNDIRMKRMHYYIGALIVLIIVIGVVVMRRRGCKLNTDCPGGSICSDGTCRPLPAPAPPADQGSIPCPPSAIIPPATCQLNQQRNWAVYDRASFVSLVGGIELKNSTQRSCLDWCNQNPTRCSAWTLDNNKTCWAFAERPGALARIEGHSTGIRVSILPPVNLRVDGI
jgi:hypothetical protein